MNKQNQIILTSLIVIGLLVGLAFLKVDLIIKVLIAIALVVLWWLSARWLMKKPDRVNIMTKDYQQLAQQLLAVLGGHENIIEVNHCQTRVLLTVKDSKLADVDAIRKLGIAGVLKPSNSKVQLIVKDLVEPISKALKQVLNHE